MSRLQHHLISLSRLWVGGWEVELRTTLPEGGLLQLMWNGETAGGAEIVQTGGQEFELRPPGRGVPYRGGPLSAVVRVKVRPWEHGARLEGSASLPAFPRGVIWVVSLALAYFAAVMLAAGDPVQALVVIGAGLSIFELVHYTVRLGVERAMAGLGASIGIGAHPPA